MPVTELRIEGYRSIREITLPLKRVNVIVGPNGCGKSNLYRGVALLRAAAEGRLARTLAEEGGIPSVMWAGIRKKGPVRLAIGVTVDEYDYEIELGLPMSSMVQYEGLSAPVPTLFGLDPLVKRETLVALNGKRRVPIVDRGSGTCVVTKEDGGRDSFTLKLNQAESVMSQLSDPRRFPLLEDFRRRLMAWRFYHTFRTDEQSPIRRPQVAVRTFALANDGIDLAAALQTIYENGNDQALATAVEDAFPGSRLRMDQTSSGMVVTMTSHGIDRPLTSLELSDGTLRYLCLLAALLSPQPAPLIALNEPETSLHESLLPPLARLLTQSAQRSQIWLTTHSQILADALCEATCVKPIALEKVEGETVRAGRPRDAAFNAEWDL